MSLLIRHRVLSCALLSLWVGAGCQTRHRPINFGAPAESYSAEDYTNVQQRWSRQARVLRQLDTALDVAATLFSPDYNQAYVAKVSQMFRYPAEKSRALAAELKTSLDTEITLIFAAATHDRQWNDFIRKDTIWRVSLANENGKQADVSKLVQIRPVTATWRELFPYIGPFHQLYRVTFPKKLPDGTAIVDAQSRYVIARFSGALGTAELIWHFR